MRAPVRTADKSLSRVKLIADEDLTHCLGGQCSGIAVARLSRPDSEKRVIAMILGTGNQDRAHHDLCPQEDNRSLDHALFSVLCGLFPTHPQFA